jgi:pimeloyl-ACP methyl ester carboxylesterase
MLSQGPRPVGYDDRGAGTPVVLLHPFPFSRGLWAGLAEVLATRYRVVTVDARGFGESPLLPGARSSVADSADDLATLLDGLKIDRAALVGLSLGGYTALAFATRHRARLAALVLADTRAAADSIEVRRARDTALALVTAGRTEAYLAASLPRLLSPAAPPALIAHLRARAETRTPNLSAGIEALRDRPDRTGELAAIACPTLVICGALDQITPAAEMRAMAEAIPGALFTEIPAAGHLAHLEAPGDFERVLSPFLSELSEAANLAASAQGGSR